MKNKNIQEKTLLEELLIILSLYFKYTLILFLFTIIITIPSFLSSSNNLVEKIILSFLPNLGLIYLILGAIIFFFYSSLGSGFDAIWTPQMQGEIQRDERERQISGFPKAMAGSLLLFSGIFILLISYIIYLEFL